MTVHIYHAGKMENYDIYWSKTDFHFLSEWKGKVAWTYDALHLDVDAMAS